MDTYLQPYSSECPSRSAPRSVPAQTSIQGTLSSAASCAVGSSTCVSSEPKASKQEKEAPGKQFRRPATPLPMSRGLAAVLCQVWLTSSQNPCLVFVERISVNTKAEESFYLSFHLFTEIFIRTLSNMAS